MTAQGKKRKIRIAIVLAAFSLLAGVAVVLVVTGTSKAPSGVSESELSAVPGFGRAPADVGRDETIAAWEAHQREEFVAMCMAQSGSAQGDCLGEAQAAIPGIWALRRELLPEIQAELADLPDGPELAATRAELASCAARYGVKADTMADLEQSLIDGVSGAGKAVMACEEIWIEGFSLARIEAENALVARKFAKQLQGQAEAYEGAIDRIREDGALVSHAIGAVEEAEPRATGSPQDGETPIVPPREHQTELIVALESLGLGDILLASTGSPMSASIWASEPDGSASYQVGIVLTNKGTPLGDYESVSTEAVDGVDVEILNRNGVATVWFACRQDRTLEIRMLTGSFDRAKELVPRLHDVLGCTN